MAGARLPSRFALALAVVLVGLAAWWTLEVLLPPEEDVGEGGGSAEALLRADGPAPPAPEPAAAEPAQPPRRVQLRRPPPIPEPPPKLVPPRAPLQPATPPPPPPQERASEEPPPTPAPEQKAPAESALVGGVARTGARGPPEVYVKGGGYWIGSPRDWVEGLAARSGREGLVGLVMEAPRHQVQVDPFWIDRTEVSNHRYWQFLQRTARILYRTSDHEPRSLVEIVRRLVRDPPANLDVEEITGRQLLRANLPALLKAFGALVVHDAGGRVDVDATYERIRDRNVPRGLELVFYDRAPPDPWPDARYPAQHGDDPVRGLSVEEAEAYALAAGRFVPTEIQWEIAARGPDGLPWPWGPTAEGYDEKVNGGRSLPRGAFPRTIPVSNLGAGASWIGCLQMLGNVSEWTTSFLDPYPGGPRDRRVPPETVLVVRGGSAADEDRYAVRPAFRGWRRDDPDGPPRPGRRRAWTGFRTARFEEPGRSRVPVMRYRARRAGRLDPDLLQGEVFEALVSAQVADVARVAGEASETLPGPGEKDFVLLPLRRIAVRLPGQRRHEANGDPNLLLPEDVLKLSRGVPGVGAEPVLLGLLHTDLDLTDLWALPEAAWPSGGLDVRLLRRALVPHGTYFLALVEGLPALASTDFAHAFFLANRPPPAAIFNVVPWDQPPGAARRPRARLRRHGADEVEARLTVPLHATASPGRAAYLDVRLPVVAEQMGLLARSLQAGHGR